jgi:hypothetical protein
MRMLGPNSNPRARTMFEIVAYVQDAEGVRFEVRTALRTKERKHIRRMKRVASSALRR